MPCVGYRFFVSIRTLQDFRIREYVPFRPGLYDPAVVGRRAAVLTFGAVVFPEGVAPHKVAGRLVIAVGEHAFFWQRGVLSLSMVIVSGIVLGLLRWLFRSIKALVLRSFRRR